MTPTQRARPAGVIHAGRRLTWAAIFAAGIGWGSGGTATRAAFEQGLGPYAISALRALLAAAGVIVFLVLSRRGLPRNPRTWKLGVVMGLTNFAAPYIFFTLAVQHASAGFVGLLTSLIPLGTALWAHALLAAERIYPAKAAAMLLAFSGVGVMVFSGDSGLVTGGNVPLATGLTMVAVAAASFAGVWAKRHTADYEPLGLTGVQFVVGTAVLIVALVVMEGMPVAITAAGWSLIVYMAVFATFMPFLLFYWLLLRVTAVQASLVGYLVPIVAVVAGIVFLDEQLQPGLALGGTLILAGVLLTDRLENRPRP